MVHSESVVLKESACKGHFVGSLDKGCTEVLPALFFTFVEHVKRGGEKLRTELLGGCEMLQLRGVREFMTGYSPEPLLLLLHEKVLFGADLSSVRLPLYFVLLIEELPHNILDLNRSQVLCRHGLRPGLLDYPLYLIVITTVLLNYPFSNASIKFTVDLPSFQACFS